MGCVRSMHGSNAGPFADRVWTRPRTVLDACYCMRAQMMRQLVNLVFCCTDREALNLAIFLHETFTLLERWRVRWQAVKPCRPVHPAPDAPRALTPWQGTPLGSPVERLRSH